MPLTTDQQRARKLATTETPQAPLVMTDGGTLVLGSDQAPDSTPAPADEAASTSMGGKIIGDYEILEEIARGAMGVVYKARQRRLNRVVALKMILNHQFAAQQDLDRFVIEAEAAARLDHAGIVPIFELAEYQGCPYFSMGLVEGTSLADSIVSGSLPWREAAAIVTKVARALAYAHEQGVIHRDIKPANILLDSKGEPKVTDFGLAKCIDHDHGMTVSGTILGTPSFMPPEQASGDAGDVDTSGDIYSLGAVLYAITTGRAPFQAADTLQILVKVLDSEPEPMRRLNPGVPQDLESICLKCLHKKPHGRYPTAAALADDLDRLLRNEPVEARLANGYQEVRRWMRQKPLLASHLVALLWVDAMVQVKYLFNDWESVNHIGLTVTLSAWVAVCLVFHAMIQSARLRGVTRYAWAGIDVAMFTAVLYLSDPPLGPLLVGYPLLIVGSGLFFRPRLVAFTTMFCLLSYAGLSVLRPDQADPYDYQITLAVMLTILGCVAVFQVNRARAMSDRYEGRKP